MADKDFEVGCPECGSLAVDMSPTSFTTAMAPQTFRDADGKVHHHDPNTTTTNLRCRSCGLNYVELNQRLCWCQSQKAATAARSESAPSSGDVLTWDGAQQVYRAHG